MPIRFGEAAFAFVFKKFIHGREHNPRPLCADAQIEVEFVVKKINVAVPEHFEKSSRDIEVIGANDSILDCKTGGCLSGNTVTGPRYDVIQNLRKRTENGGGTNLTVGPLDLAVAVHFASVGS